jgi:hypothetical protein
MCIWALQEAQNLNDNVVDAKECFARAGYMLYKGDWESWVAIVVPRSLSCSVRWSSITEFSTFMYAVAVVIGDVAVMSCYFVHDKHSDDTWLVCYSETI